MILAFLTLTATGHVIDAAVQHFMLFYAGVFALITLCASVGLGFVATDRMVLGPAHRVFVQSAHRATSFAALAFLAVHIVTEILAQRVHVLDAFIPFLSPFRTFYIGLGTIASDLIILIVITSIFRKRFSANGNAWKWRAIHYASYASFVFGVWHGLLGGRPGKPYVDWSYGLIVALVAVGLGVRILSNSLRAKETVSSAPVPAAGANSGFAAMRAMSMFAQLGMARAAAPGGSIAAGGAGSGRPTGPIMVASEVRGILTATGQGTGSWSSGWNSGPMPTAGALAAPVIADVVTGPSSGPQPSYQPSPYQQPVYEPGYDGPPRYRGAPRDPGTGPQPRGGGGG
ncbi:MAG TPA: ferric reductase-like transmembrane domain-containing protein, partial [Trebonia sp.]